MRKRMLVLAMVGSLFLAGAAMIGPAIQACSATCSQGSCDSGPCVGIAMCGCRKDGRPKCKCLGKNKVYVELG